MPRTLPWGKGSSVKKPSARRSVTAKPALKRPKLSEPPSNSSENDTTSPSKKNNAKSPSRGRVGSSSPPPEPLPEIFMQEGMEYDDRYRMVEDEFLTTAQRFTVHLHAAEYKRQKKVVKTRKAETITSISRPVTGKMPDQTRRRVESVKRAMKQQSTIDNLLGKKHQADNSESDTDLPYIGTTLHGLMDSPRRKSASLATVRPIAVATRSAAGFDKPAGQAKSFIRKRSGSPKPKAQIRAEKKVIEQGDVSTASSSDEEEENDDLDAPIKYAKK
ncbi:hypothetical protein B0O99DRAFT_680189 [Bisporella sp. PMI_857]|nr:hypothetical protein B0O99DRAFT_680189 [Bisporella sp. PMI_857]